MVEVTSSWSSTSEPSVSAVSWSAVFAGAVVAMAITIIFATLAVGFGVGSLRAWPNGGIGLKTFTAFAGCWLIVTQWVSSGIGGYITGRLRTRWHNLHTHEVFFRDTANGFIAWALATVAVAAVSVLVTKSGGSDLSAHAAAISDAASAGAVDAARKAAAGFAAFTAIGMLVGAFIACVAAALGGQQRDEHP